MRGTARRKTSASACSPPTTRCSRLPRPSSTSWTPRPRAWPSRSGPGSSSATRSSRISSSCAPSASAWSGSSPFSRGLPRPSSANGRCASEPRGTAGSSRCRNRRRTSGAVASVRVRRDRRKPPLCRPRRLRRLPAGACVRARRVRRAGLGKTPRTSRQCGGCRGPAGPPPPTRSTTRSDRSRARTGRSSGFGPPRRHVGRGARGSGRRSPARRE